VGRPGAKEVIVDDPDLIKRAERLWPLSPYLQAEWRRAVALVRSTKGGWVLDQRKPA
jgi:hypothetical protein